MKSGKSLGLDLPVMERVVTRFGLTFWLLDRVEVDRMEAGHEVVMGKSVSKISGFSLFGLTGWLLDRLEADGMEAGGEIVMGRPGSKICGFSAGFSARFSAGWFEDGKLGGEFGISGLRGICEGGNENRKGDIPWKTLLGEAGEEETPSRAAGNSCSLKMTFRDT